MRRDRAARFGQRFFHHAQDIEPALLRLLQRFGHDLGVDAADLDVHLQRGNSLVRSGDFKVHVAIVILRSRDVAENCVFVPLHHEAHGHSSHRRLQWHPGIHQRQRAATHSGHRG